MRGRIPKPTALKILAGNPGKRRLPDGEPQPTGVADEPKWLNPGAQKVWRDLAPVTAKLGLLTELDGLAFAILCTLAAEFRNDDGTMKAARISRLDSLMQRFGMDPSSRTRIRAKPPEGDDNARRFFDQG